VVFAGIDIGARATKVVILDDVEAVAQVLRPTGFDLRQAATDALEQALRSVELAPVAIDRIAATGAGRELAPEPDLLLSQARCAARGARHLVPTARTVIDVGFDQARAIRLDHRGEIVDFSANARCASGSGALAEMLARLLEVSIDELGALSLQSARPVTFAGQCAVFVEREVISLRQQQVASSDIARAVYEIIAGRIVSLVGKLGYDQPLALIGGLACDAGFVDALRRGLQIERLEIPARPELCGALGAALAAAGSE
jgi:predicted CoA-substrate-specific enzyme activase